MPKKVVSQVVRQWQILRTLEAQSATLQQLAFEFNVNPRTVRRDLECLQEAQFPIYNEHLDDLTVRWHLLRKGVAPVRRAA